MISPTTLSADQASALQSLGYLYLQHGQFGRGLALIILADRGRPGVTTIMRTLAYAYLKNEEPRKALQVIERIEELNGILEPTSTLQLLRAQALWLAGEKKLGRQVFTNFNRARSEQNLLKNYPSDAPENLNFEPDFDPNELVLGQGDRT